MATHDSPSLYERLGGVYSIATVVDDFIDRIMVDPRLNANPKGRRGTSSRFASRLQIPRYGNGVLGSRRAANVYRPLHEGFTPRPHDHGGRVGCLS